MTKNDSTDSALAQMTDTLKLQAHLAQMERAEPSAAEPAVLEEASTLARMRDKLRVQIHLGELEVKEEWKDAEVRWRKFIQRTVRPAAKEIADTAEDSTNDLLAKIRDSYKRLTAG